MISWLRMKQICIKHFTCSLVLRLQTGVDRTKFWQVTVSFTHEKNLSGLGMAMVKQFALREKVSQQSSSSEKKEDGRSALVGFSASNSVR